MGKFRLIGKIATGSTAVSIIFLIISIVLEYNYFKTFNAGAAIEYTIAYILPRMLPYLFTAIASIVVAVISRSAIKNKKEEEKKPKEPDY